MKILFLLRRRPKMYILEPSGNRSIKESSRKPFNISISRFKHFLTTRCIWTPWIFAFSGFSAVSDLDNHLRDPLRSWGSLIGFFIFPTFLEEAPKWSANFSQSIPRELAFVFPHPTYSGVYALFGGSDILGGLHFWSRFWVFDRPTSCLVALLLGSWSSQSSP